MLKHLASLSRFYPDKGKAINLLFNFSKAQSVDKKEKTINRLAAKKGISIPDEIYQQVNEELKAKRGDSALRAKAIIQAEGDNTRVKAIYIQLRAESIMMALESEKKNTLHAHSPFQKKYFCFPESA